MTLSANTPGNTISIDDFYDADPLEPNLLYQGEILVNVPILRMHRPSRWQLLRTRSGRRLDEALEHGNLGGQVRVLDSNQSKEEWQANSLGDFAMAVLDKSPAVVLNQTCDIQNNDFLQIAPIFSVATQSENASQDPEAIAANTAYIERLKSGGIFSAVWIKKHPPAIPTDAYADLELIQAVHKDYVKRIRSGQHLRLTAARTRILQSAITRYFGRPNSFDSRFDVVPQTGTYLCVSCFYMDARVTPSQLREGDHFGNCDVCHGTQWVLKGR